MRVRKLQSDKCVEFFYGFLEVQTALELINRQQTT